MAEGIGHYVEGVTLDIDVTPPWWGGAGLVELCGAACRVLTTSPNADPIASIEIGIDGIRVRCPWSQDWVAGAVEDWRRLVLAAFDAMPEAQQAIAIHREVELERLRRKPWRVRSPERAAIVYGCGHERAVDPTKPATLDSEERCPTCTAA